MMCEGQDNNEKTTTTGSNDCPDPTTPGKLKIILVEL